MPTIDIIDLNRRKVGAAELRPEVFGVEVKTSVLHEVVVMQEANRRQGTASTKTRSIVSGTGRKALQAEAYRPGPGRLHPVPVWRHGGIVFGPHPRDYGYSIPQGKARGACVRPSLAKSGTGGC